MREITLAFEGHVDSERKAADIIQAAIFDALAQERMNVLQFQNRQSERKEKVAIGTPEQISHALEIPDFMKKNNP